MYTIEVDDYAQTSFPSWDSDGAVRLFWDHPDHPGQWSGQHCRAYPYEDWTEVRPLRSTGDSFGAWSLHNIILGHFGLFQKGIRIPWEDILTMSPDRLIERKHA